MTIGNLRLDTRDTALVSQIASGMAEDGTVLLHSCGAGNEDRKPLSIGRLFSRFGLRTFAADDSFEQCTISFDHKGRLSDVKFENDGMLIRTRLFLHTKYPIYFNDPDLFPYQPGATGLYLRGLQAEKLRRLSPAFVP